MSLEIFVYRDLSLAALASGARANLLVVQANSPQEADTIVRRTGRIHNNDQGSQSSNGFANFGNVSFATATWTAGTKTLTQAGAFTNLDSALAVGALVNIVSGTGATPGWTTVASKTSNNAIVLTDSIAAGDLAGGDIVGYIEMGRVITRINYLDAANLLHTLPNPGSNEAGVGLNKGCGFPSDTPGIIFELTATVA